MQSTKETIREIEVFCRSKFGGIWIRTAEEYRARRAVEQIARNLNCKVVFWSCISGFGVYVDGRLVWQIDVINQKTTAIQDEVPFPVSASFDGEIHDDLLTAFQNVRNDDDRALYCFLDAADFLETELTGPEPRTMRALREMIGSIGDFAPEQAKALLFIDRKPSPRLPNVVNIDFPLPNKEEVDVIVTTVIDNLPNADTVKLDLAENGRRDEVITAVRGLEAEAISNAIKTSVVATSKIIPERLLNSKKTIISGKGFVKWQEPDEIGLDNIGGLEGFKARAVRLKSRLSSRAQAYGLKSAFNLLVAGVPGTGKSLGFRGLLALLQISGLRVMPFKSKYVGESSANLIEIFRIARAVAPVMILWDEAEKMFGTPEGDTSGVSMELLGILLTEMQYDFDNSTGVLHYFTANNPTIIKGEMLSRCETGGIFWVDLPNETELTAICEVMKRRYPKTDEVNSEEIAKAALKRELTGREVEIAFLNAMEISFADDERKTITADVLETIAEVVPVIKSYQAQIDALRLWGKDKRQASIPDKVKAPKVTKADDKLKSIM